MIDPAGALLLFTFFQATEKVIGYAGGKVADAMSKPVWEAVEGKTRWLTKNDDTTKRWQAFTKAFEQAKATFEQNTPNPEVARRLSTVLENFTLKTTADREWVNILVPTPDKVSLFSKQPDISTITDLISAALIRAGEQPPSRAELSEAVAFFVRVFQDRLFVQPAYQEILQNQVLRQQVRQPYHDTRERYLEQIIRYHRDLDFVGIPELKDRQALHLEEVFIHLQAEIEVKQSWLEEEEHDLEKYIEARDAKNVRQYLGERNQATRGRKFTQKLSVNEALKKYNRMVILGDPGAGKTTLLKYVALAFATRQSEHLGFDEDRLPIFIRLYDYVAKRAERQTDYSLVDYLCTQAHENLALSLDVDFFQDALERGECCVCLDGLDELGGAGLRREVIAAVNALVNKYPRNRYLITSRLVGYEEAPLNKREFVHLTVLPFSDEDIHAFVTNWYAVREADPAAARERSQHLIDTIMDEPRIQTLAANPLMLTIIALVHRIEAGLPYERVKLYNKCVTVLVQTWDEVKGLRVEDRQRTYYKHRRRLLEQLAYWMHNRPGEQGRTREVKEGDLKLLIRRFLSENPKWGLDDDTAQQEAYDFVRLVKSRTGLLIEHGEGVYSFAHLTFQEYLAAAEIEYRLVGNIDALWEEIQPRLHDAHWREVILLLLGSLNKFEQHTTALVRRIFESTDAYEPVLHRHLYLAAQALADQVQVDTKLHHAIIDQLMAVVNLQEVWGSEDVFAALGLLKGDHYAADRLLVLAQDSRLDLPLRCAAMDTLGQLGYADEAAQLLLPLARDSQVDPMVKRDAIIALGQLGWINEAITLSLVLAQDSQVAEDVHREATQAEDQLVVAAEATSSVILDFVKDSQMAAEAWRTIAEVMDQVDRADNVARMGLHTLVQTPNVNSKVQSAIRQLLEQLAQAEEDAEPLYNLTHDSQATAEELSSIPQTLSQLCQHELAMLKIVQELAHLCEKNIWGQFYAAQALSRLSQTDETALTGLLTLAQDSKVAEDVRLIAANMLGAFGQTDEAVHLLVDLAQNFQVDEGVRCSAAQALGEFGRTDEALRLLLTFTQDIQMDEEVRCKAAQALSELGHADEVAELLLIFAQDSRIETWDRCDCVVALGRISPADEVVLRSLRTLAEDAQEDIKVRIVAAQALSGLGPANEVAELLFTFAQDSRTDAEERRDCLEALGRIGSADEVVLEGLRTLAQDSQEDAEVRIAAAQALSELDPTNEVAKRLLAFAQDSRIATEERSARMEALRQAGQTDEVTERLLIVAQDTGMDEDTRINAYYELKSLLGIKLAETL